MPFQLGLSSNNPLLSQENCADVTMTIVIIIIIITTVINIIIIIITIMMCRSDLGSNICWCYAAETGLTVAVWFTCDSFTYPYSIPQITA